MRSPIFFFPGKTYPATFQGLQQIHDLGLFIQVFFFGLGIYTDDSLISFS